MRNPRNEPLAVHDIADLPGAGDGPERRCVLSGRIAARDELVRLAVSPPNGAGVCDVLPDALARAPGRGAWIGVSQAELAAALANGKLKAALARAFKSGALAIPEDLPARVEASLTRALLDRLGLELRAGRLILGSDRIAGEARLGRVAALYHAGDASPDGARKLDQAWRVGSEAEGSGQTGTRLPLDRAALSVALGRDNVVHLALADRASAERVAIPLQRLLNFMGAAPQAASDVPNGVTAQKS
ncbi:MAG: nucleic-acid-binding protein [Sphingomonadales bacterium 12-68-11]|nr:MAG: nucleic-acid-binding protein [Sphingomonadales bacterium 12-68-11]